MKLLLICLIQWDMTNDDQLRIQLVSMLKGGHAHASFDEAVQDVPLDLLGERPQGLPHSAWELLEHLRIAQKDILEFSRSANHKPLNWPDEYWPPEPGPKDPDDWHTSAEGFRKDMKEFISLVEDGSRDLYQAFPWGKGQSLLREAILLIDHNSYHLGQLLLVRKGLGAWN